MIRITCSVELGSYIGVCWWHGLSISTAFLSISVFSASATLTFLCQNHITSAVSPCCTKILVRSPIFCCPWPTHSGNYQKICDTDSHFLVFLLHTMLYHSTYFHCRRDKRLNEWFALMYSCIQTSQLFQFNKLGTALSREETARNHTITES